MIEQEIPTSPKTFVSYSWGTPEHNEWVVQIATELRESGVDVILDRWDLRENDDKYVFMETMVTDPSVRKVVMICDKKYKEKADKREGGVGTETQIISDEVYQKVKSDEDKRHKFCAVIKEIDENGKPFVPIYLKSRIYIDMSNEEKRDENFEQLLRWIFDKPLEKKPAIGKPPAFLFEDEKTTLSTSSRFRLATNAVSQAKPNAVGLVRDYLETFSGNFEALRITPLAEGHFDDQIIKSVEEFLPYRNEFLDLVTTIVRYSSNDDYILEIGTFFESLLPYLSKQKVSEVGYGRHLQNNDNDNYRLIILELFTFTIALLLKHHKFEWVNELLAKEYYLETESYQERSANLYPYTVMFQPIYSLEERGKRTGEATIVANLFKNHTRKDLSFEDVMQADLVLYLRHELLNLRGRWFPFSLVFAPYQKFELFIRAESSKFFERFKVSLGINNKDALEKFLSDYEKGEIDPVRLSYYNRLDIRPLLNLERLATKA